MALRIRPVLRRAMALALLLLMICSFALASPMSCYINSNTKVYQSASTSSRSLNVSKGLTATLTSFNNYWARLERQGCVAYIPIQYITLSPRLEWYCNQNTTLYKSASTSSAKVYSLTKGTKVYIAGRMGSYFRVENQNASISGYVLISHVSSTAPKTEAPASKPQTPAPDTRTKQSTICATPLYASASTSSKKIMTLRKGETLYVTGQSGNFLKVENQSGNYKGYVIIGHSTADKRPRQYTSCATPLYASASTSSKKIMTLRKGETLFVTGQSGYFLQVENQAADCKGYVLIGHSSADKRPKQATIRSTPLYSGASTSSSVTMTLRQGETLYVTGQSGEFLQVENQIGDCKGYVLVAHTTAAPKASTGNSKINTVINVANSYIGSPYNAKANPPQSFDCSRFVKYCYEQAGITLLASAETQGYSGNYAKITNASDLKIGDVVCFNTNSSDGDLSDHTGIYLGNGNFIHASSAAGKVIISTLSSGYYERTFSWGRRIV